MLLVFIVLPVISPVLAQVSPVQLRDIPAVDRKSENQPYKPYNSLFDVSGTELSGERSTLRVESSDWANARYATDLTYVFNGGFNVLQGNPGRHDASWYWDKIADAGGNRKLFMLRICNVGSDGRPIETTCAFSPWPYGKDYYPDDYTGINVTNVSEDQIATVINQLKTLIQQQLTKKIYHYVLDYKSLEAEKTTDEKYRLKDFPKIEESYSFSVVYKPSAFQYSNDTAGAIGKTLAPGQRYQADLWYCASKDGGLGNLAGNDDALEDVTAAVDNIRVFGFCDSEHLAYIRAAGLQFTIPQNQAEIDAGNAGATGANLESNSGHKTDVMPNCHIINGWGPGSGSFVGCIAFLFYYGVFWPISWFAGIMGNLFDFFLGYTLDDASYRAEFVVTGWKLVRDISNIFFIVILVWVGLATALGIPKVSMKKVVPQLIVNALIINFSLFGTRVLVDISNVAARLFYNTISVCEGKCRDDNADGQIDNPKKGSTQYKPLSEKIVSAFDPQRIFTPELLTNKGFTESKLEEGTQDGDKEDPLNKNSYATIFVIISIIAAFIMFAIAMMFWKTAFFFLGRTIGLYVSMIFAPFAVLTMGEMPLIGGIKQLSWKDWWSNFVQYVLLAPVFVFFLYIVYSFINTDFLKIVAGRDTDGLFGGSFMPVIISISVPLLIVYTMIKQGVKIAETFSGQIGAMVQKAAIGGSLAATVAGVASGGIAAVGRGTIGRIGASMANSQTLRKLSGSDNWFARQIGNTGVRLGEKGASATFDARNTSLLKTMDITGKENAAITKMTRTATENTKGGVFGSQDRKEKAGYKRMQTYQLTGDLADAQNKKVSQWEDAHIKTAMDNWKQQNPYLVGTKAEAQAKKSFIATQIMLGEKPPKSADEINLERNIAYAKRQKNGNILTRIGGKIATATGLGGTTAGVIGVLNKTMVPGAIGGAVGAVTGELATDRVAEQRVGKNVGRLESISKQIAEVNALIAPLQTAIAATGGGPGERERLKQLESRLKGLESQLESLNKKFSQE